MGDKIDKGQKYDINIPGSAVLACTKHFSVS